MQLSLEKKVDPLLDWGPNALPKLVDYIYGSKQIVMGRLRYAASQHARMYGWAKDDMFELADDVELDPDSGLLGMFSFGFTSSSY